MGIEKMLKQTIGLLLFVHFVLNYKASFASDSEANSPTAEINSPLFYVSSDNIASKLSLAEVRELNKVVELGNQYYFGREGHAKSYDKAFKLFKEAAEGGLARAQGELGFCYREGIGVDPSLAEALYWYRKGARLGDDISQVNLGNFYYWGRVVRVNFETALKWYFAAAMQGNRSAIFNIGVCFQEGNGLNKDSKQAAVWFLSAAQAGSAEAQYYLGKCYEVGDGTPIDLAKAKGWYDLAAKLGHDKALERLDEMD